MLELLFSDYAAWFGVPALLGTAVFILRVGMMFLGHAGIDMHHDLGGGHDMSDAHHSDSTDSFRVLSVQGIAAFLMGFGWGGLGVLRGTNWNAWYSAPVGIACGAGMVWLLGALLKAAYDLQSTGNVRISDTVGIDGTVYVTVPEEGRGRGQVQIVVNQQQCFFNAVTHGPALITKTRVKVIGFNEDNTLTVSPV